MKVNTKIKDEKLAEKIEANPISKEEFEGVLKKACKPIKSQTQKD